MRREGIEGGDEVRKKDEAGGRGEGVEEGLTEHHLQLPLQPELLFSIGPSAYKPDKPFPISFLAILIPHPSCLFQIRFQSMKKKQRLISPERFLFLPPISQP